MTETNEALADQPAMSAKIAEPTISIELAPEQVRSFAPAAEYFPLGSRVFLTHLAGKMEAVQVDAALRIKAMGYAPVPHFGARNFKSEKDFVDLVTAHSRNGISEALFLGGNPLMFPGPLAEAAQLLAHPVLLDSAIRTAFVSGYPEGHPNIGEAELADATRRKIEICEGRSLETRIVSQFAFDGSTIGKWARNLHTNHPGLPVHIGLAGVTSLTKLIRFAMTCGVGPSIAALNRSATGFFNAISDRNPADVLETMMANYPHPSSPLHLHFFPFGGWQKTLSWFGEYQRVLRSRTNQK